MDTISPEELVLWCQRTLPDDTRAFEALVGLYKRSVFTTAYRLMADRHEAEDQAQEVFLKIFRGIKSLSEPATLPAWVHRITVNTCLDALEKRKRRPATTSISRDEGEGEGDREYEDKSARSPAASLEQDELRRCLESALARLDPEGRGVIVLRDVEGLSYDEVAGALKIGLSAVKMRIHRARLAVQKLIEQLCPGVWNPSSV